MANTTKRMLALSLKKLLARTTLDNITVQQVVEDAEVSRKTFYYHFHDVYDLLEWTLVEDTRALLVQDSKHPESLGTGLSGLVDYLIQNRTLILNAYHSLERSVIEKELIDFARPYLVQFFSSIEEFNQLSEEDRKFIIDMYAFGLSGMILHWIGEGMSAKPERMIHQIQRFFSSNIGSAFVHWLTPTA